MTRRLVSAWLAIFFCLALPSGCAPDAPTSAEPISSSLRSHYEVDEELSLDGAYLIARFGKAELRVAIDESMVEGFDSSTTGRRTLTISYAGLKMPFEYSVTYREAVGNRIAEREITTDARLTLSVSAPTDADALEYSIGWRGSDPGRILAAYFTLRSETPIANSPSDLRAFLDYEANLRFRLNADGTTLRVLVFDISSDALPNPIARIRAEKGTNRSVTLQNISLSDGKTTLYLPRTSK